MTRGRRVRDVSWWTHKNGIVRDGKQERNNEKTRDRRALFCLRLYGVMHLMDLPVYGAARDELGIVGTSAVACG